MLFINMKLETCMIEVEKTTTLNDAKKLVLDNNYIYPEEQVWFSDNEQIKNQKIDWNDKSKYSIIVNNNGMILILKQLLIL